MQPMTRSALRCDDHVYHSLSNLMEFGTNKPRSVFHLLLSNKSKVRFELHGRLNLALARAAPPSAPTITSLISTYSDQLTVTWTYAPTATRYNVSINDSVNTLVPILSTGAPQYTFTGLTNNTVYSVSVVAINCAGSSSPATITTRTKQCTDLNAFQGVEPSMMSLASQSCLAVLGKETFHDVTRQG
ncbi:hypothetical protein EMCRGX_G015599 [Ephydatia muelleri]